jgi:Long-chain acyl-CoA synthetases (AMP-forming)
MGCSHSELVYSVPINSLDSCKGESQTYRSLAARHGLTSGFKSHPELQTFQDIFLNSVKSRPDKQFLGTRETLPDGTRGPYKFKTYQEVLELCTKVGSGIVNLELAPTIDTINQVNLRLVAVYSKNREEWVELDLACSLYGLTIVPIYDTLGPDSVEYIFQHTGLTTCFCSGNYIDNLLRGFAAKKDHKLVNLVSFDKVTTSQIDEAKKCGITLYTWDEVIRHGEKTRDFTRVTREHLFTFAYTSGTTGNPKAAMISHGNLIATVAAIDEIQEFASLGADDIHLSYLPLAHSMERVFTSWLIYKGGSIGFYSGDVLKLKNDLQELKPTLFLSVPRLFNKFHDAMWEGIKKQPDGLKKKMAYRAVSAKLSNLRLNAQYTHSIYDSLVFSKMRDALGGRIRIMLSASAPIATEVIDFLKIAVGVPIIEAYGQTESTAASFLTRIQDPISGHVGGPVNSIEFKVIDVPEMNYFAKDKDVKGDPLPRGEICIRGPSVFRGYYKDPEKTAEAIDKDGWLHTGDIGQIHQNGSLKIIDRKKNIFKIAIGEYIAPEKIEKIYVRSNYILNAYVVGDPLQYYTIVIVVPNKENIMALAQELGVSGTYEEVCKNKDVADFILGDLNRLGREAKLYSFEMAKKIYIEPKHFMDMDFVTPSLKLKRHVMKAHYEKIIKELYSTPLEEKKDKK